MKPILITGSGVFTPTETVSNEELFAAVGKPEGVPEIDAWVHDWAAASALPPVRVKAPSVWG